MTQQQPTDNASALTEAKAEFELAKQVTITEMMRSGIVTEGASRRIGNAATAYIAALEAELAATRAQLEAATGALSVFVTIAPAWQGNYAYNWNEVLIIVGAEWRNGELFYEVLGRAGKGYIDAAQLQLAATSPAGAEEDGR